MLTQPVETALRAEWIEDAERFAELESDWEELAEAEALPFSRHAWLAAWWAAFGTGAELRILTLREGGELVGALPLCLRGRQLEAAANVHTPLFRPLARSETVLRRLADEALGTAGGTVAIGELAADDPAVGLLERGARSHGRLPLVRAGRVSPLVELDGEFADYLGGMDKKARKELERQRRRLGELGAVFEPLAVPDDLGLDLAKAFGVEASGWKGARGTAIAAAPVTLSFYRQVALRFLAQDRFRLSTIRLGDRLVAFDYTLLDGNRLWILKGGFDEEFRRFAPGILLTLAEIERAYALGLDAVELCGDEAPWKARFATGARAQCTVSAYARRPAPLADYGYRRFVRPRLRAAYHRALPSRNRG